MSSNFRTLLALKFSHAAALARALDTLKSHDVFGGIPVSESAARDIGTCFITDILEGKCPQISQDINTVEGLDHLRNKVTFIEGQNACIEAFNVIIMDHSARVTLTRALSHFKLESNKDMHDLLWADDKATHGAITTTPHHGISCDCETCEDLRND